MKTCEFVCEYTNRRVALCPSRTILGQLSVKCKNVMCHPQADTSTSERVGALPAHWDIMKNVLRRGFSTLQQQNDA